MTKFVQTFAVSSPIHHPVYKTTVGQGSGESVLDSPDPLTSGVVEVSDIPCFYTVNNQ